MNKDIRNFFSQEEKASLKKAILNAELDTSGEIRVHLEWDCKGSVLDRSAYIFRHLKMDQTHLRNGVLFYLALNSRKFAVIGDVGINQVVPENFWEDIKKEISNAFANNQFLEGLTTGISMAGLKLKKHFPHHVDDINELPDEISFG